MPPTKASNSEKKTKSSTSSRARGRKKLSPFNKFMQEKLAELKVELPNMSHQDRFKKCVEEWNIARQNPVK